MARSLDQYSHMLLALLPRGYAWPTDGALGDISMALAEELQRIEGRAEGLLDEADPRTVIELIEDWEGDWGLPDPCLGQLGTLQQRRELLTNKIVGIANQSRQTYIDRAADLGYAITITEYTEGDAISGHPQIPLLDAAYVIQINSTVNTIDPRTYSAFYGEAYATWGNEILECALNAIKQSHRLLIFNYS